MSLGWNLDKPLRTMCDSATNEADKKLWESDHMGGITEDNNRMPMPVVLLVILTVFTAFAITFPLWGQRPTASLYVGYVKAMNTPEVKAIQNDDDAMKAIVKMNLADANQDKIVRHPISMDDLRIVAPQIQALMDKGADLEEYSVVGDSVVIANFEGNKKADGSVTRKQPWWDAGYVIDIFYLTYFFVMVIILIKRLPPSSWQPKHH